MKNRFAVIAFFCWLCASGVYGQTGDSLPERKFPSTGALVAYYLWEEDSNGILVQKKPAQPFLQNYYVLKQADNDPKRPASLLQVQKAIDFFANDPGHLEAEKYYLEDSAKQIQKIRFPLVKSEALKPGSVIFRLKNGQWESLKRHNVLYFTIDTTGAIRYSHSTDSLVVFSAGIRRIARSHYVVYNYMNIDGYIGTQRVENYEGEDVTAQLTAEPVDPVRMLVFVNGYRGPKKNDDPTDGVLTQKDRYGYWYKLDNQFIDRLKPAVSWYADGSMPIATSNHRTKLGFAWSYVRTWLTFRKKKSKRIFARLNTESNEEGFNERREKGKLAGLAFLTARCNEPHCETVRDTIDIVCHSMGYAYTLGFIDVVRDKVVFGNLYIIAPENACFAGSDWSQFRQVWQYGSNLDQEDPDPVKQQDGIAPQCAVKGLDSMPATTCGRAFIPKDWPNKNFIDSHMVYSYDWIFECIKEGEAGFVTK